VLLRYGADPNTVVLDTHEYDTALTAALDWHEVRPMAAAATVKTLLDHGADVTCARPGGQTPLALAEVIARNIRRRPGFYRLANAKSPERNRKVEPVADDRMDAARKEMVEAIIAAGKASK
jgi:hypothetical protein